MRVSFGISAARTAYFLLFAAIVLAGLGRAALLPPFEGVDETAHYSRILASAWPPDDPQQAQHIDIGVYNYYAHGPMSEGWIHNASMHGKDPRMDKPEDAPKVYKDYHRFFDDKNATEEYGKIYRAKTAERGFFPSTQTNWQVQHPPAYYALAGVVLKLLPDLTLHGRIFALRAFGFLLAVCAFAAAMAATGSFLKSEAWGERAAALGMFYPFLMPAFFNDLTRMGNDTLALAAFCLMWAFLLRHLKKPDDSAEWIGLGLSCGFALMVKATMMAPFAGAVLFLLAFNLKRKGLRGLQAPLCVLGLALLIAAKWYAGYLGAYAFTSGHSGMKIIVSGMEAGKLPLAKIPFFIVESLFGAVAHFTDWSSYLFDSGYKVIIGLPVLAALGFYAAHLLRGRTLLSAATLPVWTAGPLLAGVALHSVSTGMAIGPEVAPTPAYYAHVAAPAFALALGIGLERMIAGRKQDVAAILSLMALGMTGYLLVRQALLYGGCWWPNGDVIAKGACYADAPALYARLAVISNPGAAAGLLAAALCCALAGLLPLLRPDPVKSAKTEA